MFRSLLLAGAASAALATAAPASASPTVVTDIPAVHALVSTVMQGVGEPEMILPPGASPHGYAMRPSEAAALQSADVVVWIGEALTPWLERAIDTLAPDAVSVELLAAPGATTHEFRDGATFEKHDHDHDEHEEHAHDDHAHDETAAADHDHEDDAHDAPAHDDHAHDHDGVDPHAWLDPENGKVWLDAIAAALSAADPVNAGAFFQNAAAGKAELDALIADISADLAPVRDRGFVVFHDAYQYFEARFGVEATGAISLGDAAAPSPARVAEIKGAIEAMDAACVFSEPQFEPALVETVIEGTNARSGVLDPLGAKLPLGPSLYPALLSNMRDSLLDCLGG
jgi:zinc transport system substrate-binding protein